MTEQRVYLLEKFGIKWEPEYHGVFRSPTRAFAYVDEHERVTHTWERTDKGQFTESRKVWRVTPLPFNPVPHRK